MKYKVYDTNKPAIYEKSEAWNNCTFSSLKEAVDYAIDWLGDYGDDMPEDLSEASLPYKFEYGYGAFIEIKKEDQE